jgi:hypothetical protein
MKIGLRHMRYRGSSTKRQRCGSNSPEDVCRGWRKVSVRRLRGREGCETHLLDCQRYVSKPDPPFVLHCSPCSCSNRFKHDSCSSVPESARLLTLPRSLSAHLSQHTPCVCQDRSPLALFLSSLFLQPLPLPPFLVIPPTTLQTSN